MNITMSQAKVDYLDQVRNHLVDIPEEDRDEVIQDLEAHLAELDDADLETELGNPSEFAREFRISAGLEETVYIGRTTRLRSTALSIGEKFRAASAKLSAITRWPSIRPLWVWTRGWVLVSAFSILYYDEGFRHFPIPSLGYSTLTGLLFVGAATAVSVWIDQKPLNRFRRAGTTMFSLVAGGALLAAMVNPLPDPRTEFVEVFEPHEMISPSGEAVHNIYAYDLEGNPLEVLLYDQDGEPLLTVSELTLHDAEMNDGDLFFGDGGVRFRQDQFGRIIPNLYPLVLLRHDEMGNLQPIPPPPLGFPGSGDIEDEEPWPGTTIVQDPPNQ